MCNREYLHVLEKQIPPFSSQTHVSLKCIGHIPRISTWIFSTWFTLQSNHFPHPTIQPSSSLLSAFSSLYPPLFCAHSLRSSRRVLQSALLSVFPLVCPVFTSIQKKFSNLFFFVLGFHCLSFSLPLLEKKTASQDKLQLDNQVCPLVFAPGSEETS